MDPLPIPLLFPRLDPLSRLPDLLLFPRLDPLSRLPDLLRERLKLLIDPRDPLLDPLDDASVPLLSKRLIALLHPLGPRQNPASLCLAPPLPPVLPLQVSGPIRLRAEVDIGLAAQLRRLLQVPGPLRHVPPLGQAAVIDPLPVTGPLQRPIRLPLPTPCGCPPATPGAPPPWIFVLRPSPGPPRCAAGTTAPGCARCHRWPAPRTSGARGGSPRLRDGPPACRAAAPLRSSARRTRRPVPAAVPRSVPWEARTGLPGTAARWPARTRPPPPNTSAGHSRPTPAYARSRGAPVPPGPARSAPRARCNRPWPPPTAHRHGNRRSFLDEKPPPTISLRLRSAHAMFLGEKHV